MYNLILVQAVLKVTICPILKDKNKLVLDRCEPLPLITDLLKKLIIIKYSVL